MQFQKKTYVEAKVVALKNFNACPTDVIHYFINHSLHFMSAYHMGFTGKAAAWTVRKQKQHRQVSERAMMSIKGNLELINILYNKSFIPQSLKRSQCFENFAQKFGGP